VYKCCDLADRSTNQTAVDLLNRSYFLVAQYFCIRKLQLQSVEHAAQTNSTNSVEIPTRCSFVIEFIIPRVLNAQHVLVAHRSSSGTLNCIYSLWFICPYGDRPLPRLSGHWIKLGNGRSSYGHINQSLQIQFRAPDDERCVARNMLNLQ
jgi:hypothetical protein